MWLVTAKVWAPKSLWKRTNVDSIAHLIFSHAFGVYACNYHDSYSDVHSYVYFFPSMMATMVFPYLASELKKDLISKDAIETWVGFWRKTNHRYAHTYEDPNYNNTKNHGCHSWLLSNYKATVKCGFPNCSVALFLQVLSAMLSLWPKLSCQIVDVLVLPRVWLQVWSLKGLFHAKVWFDLICCCCASAFLSPYCVFSHYYLFFYQEPSIATNLILGRKQTALKKHESNWDDKFQIVNCYQIQNEYILESKGHTTSL